MRKLRGFLSIIIVLSVVSIGAMPAVAATNNWQTHSTENFNIYYKSGYTEDAEKVGNMAETARKQLLQSVPENVSLSLSNKISIYVYSDESWEESPYSLNWRNTQPVKINLLAPSDSPVNEGWYQHGIAAELGNIVVWDVASDNTDYRFWSRNPGWFYEGLTEFYVYKTPSVADQFPAPELKKLNQSIREDHPSIQKIMDNRYFGGQILNMYLIDEYGEQAAWDIIRSDEKSFEEALSKSIGISYTKFKQNWYNWANKHINANYSATNLEMSGSKTADIKARYTVTPLPSKPNTIIVKKQFEFSNEVNSFWDYLGEQGINSVTVLSTDGFKPPVEADKHGILILKWDGETNPATLKYELRHTSNKTAWFEQEADTLKINKPLLRSYSSPDVDTYATLNVTNGKIIENSRETVVISISDQNTTPTDSSSESLDTTSESAKTTIQDSDGDGMIDSQDYAPRDPEVQEKGDLQTTSTSAPGIGMLGALSVFLFTLFVTHRNS